MQKLTERIDDLKQRIAAWGKRIRRYTERSTRFNQNRLFQSDQKRLYKSLERPMVSGTAPVPNQADTVAFWRGLWSEPVNHNEGPWTEVVASQCAGITPMDPVTITPDDVAEAVHRAPNWKSPGLDGLHHYWLKGFRYQYTSIPREAYGRVVTKASPNVVRTPDYDEMFGMLNVPHTSGKILRYPGPPRPLGQPSFMITPQRDRFEALKKLIRKEHVPGRGNEDFVNDNYGEAKPRGLQPLQVEYPADDSTRHSKKPPSGSRQVSQFSRLRDVMLPPVRRTYYHPYFDYPTPEFVPYVY
ncbi:unnamed protein product [Parnassius apollo]|uniref:(apollo) hypothetical protein n=1 Tax=Parnassius apollo TaxID=110799 RepID=A0A8S3XR31_PARAO|nr:unnamed protein product [Parnassius apollo]